MLVAGLIRGQHWQAGDWGAQVRACSRAAGREGCASGGGVSGVGSGAALRPAPARSQHPPAGRARPPCRSTHWRRKGQATRSRPRWRPHNGVRGDTVGVGGPHSLSVAVQAVQHEAAQRGGGIVHCLLAERAAPLQQAQHCSCAVGSGRGTRAHGAGKAQLAQHGERSNALTSLRCRQRTSSAGACGSTDGCCTISAAKLPMARAAQPAAAQHREQQL